MESFLGILGSNQMFVKLDLKKPRLESLEMDYFMYHCNPEVDMIKSLLTMGSSARGRQITSFLALPEKE